jgi:8-oxo-dGTP pyrophosphatase MutT (NUDIX family)
MAQHNISVACILKYEDKVLMIKESQQSITQWDIPAGGLDQAENIFDGVKREVLEEVGISIKDPELITTFQTISNNESSFCFLFRYKLSASEYSQLNITEHDILDCKLFSKDELQNLVDNNEVEHALAKRRLMEVLVNDNNGKIVII